MNGWALGGLLLILYGIFCLVMGITKKPEKLWQMGKIQGFVKVLGLKGSQIFFCIWGAAALGVGIWFMTKG